jgi:hypothetical protein
MRSEAVGISGRVVASAVVAGLLCLPASGSAATTEFTAAGCGVWSVPPNVSTIDVAATGAAGSRAGGAPGSAGLGDTVSATVSDVAGSELFVCVDVGGGAGGSSATSGGDGGGASGVAIGADFAVPLLVAGGGGGEGTCGEGGDAGMPIAGAGTCFGGGGGDNSTMTGGAGGSGGGSSGARCSAAGPGIGGAGGVAGSTGGGGGGGGYFGGGGGGAASDAFGASVGGSGGGGSDFCENAGSVSDCAVVSGAGTATGAGDGPGEAKVVFTYTFAPSLAASASPGVELGGPVTDTASLSGGGSPTGELEFRLHGPGDPGCAEPAVFSDTVAVGGNGDYTSAPFVPTEPGTYRWVASYSGDADNAAVQSACDDPAQRVTVAPRPDPPPVPTRAEFAITGVEVDEERGTAELQVAFNLDGTLRIDRTKRVAPTAELEVDGPGTAALEVRARGRARKRLERTGKVHVNPRALYAAAGGQIGERRLLRLRLD